MIIDRDDIILWTRKYLRLIREYRAQNKKIYYLDETWVNEGHTKPKAWVDTTIKTKKQAFLSGLSTGLKNPSGKGKRLIITHIGSDSGFVEGGLLMFESRKTVDYHEEMTGAVFQQWFEGILPKLQPNSIIVLDNASIHSTKLYSRPSKSWKKQKVVDWLLQRNVSFSDTLVKAELVKIAQNLSDIDENTNKYVIDNIAKYGGHTLLRPGLHCIERMTYRTKYRRQTYGRTVVLQQYLLH